MTNYIAIRSVLLLTFISGYVSHSNSQDPSVIKHHDASRIGISASGDTEPPATINGVAVPVDFPGINVTVNGNTAPGHLFMTNKEGPPYLMILKNDGTPYYYEKLL